jgi:hypothetical protein
MSGRCPLCPTGAQIKEMSYLINKIDISKLKQDILFFTVLWNLNGKFIVQKTQPSVRWKRYKDDGFVYPFASQRWNGAITGK